jgi:aminotransferase
MLSLRAVPVAVTLDPPHWHLDIDRLRTSITPRTRAIILNTPSNPCGKVFSLAELEAIAALAIDHDLFVFTDEIYEYFLFDGRRHISLATLPGMAERTITISGLSKTFSITGWRIGYLTASSQWIPTIGYFHDLVYICAPGPFQYGAATGLVGLSATFYSDLARDYQQKRDQLCAALTDAGLTPSIPEGAYYVLADATRIAGQTAAQKARTLLAATGVAAVAGSAFFVSGGGENLLRFCFGKQPDALDRACAALRKL